MSMINEFRSIEQQIASLQAQQEKLAPKVQAQLQATNEVIAICESNNISRREMAMALVPDLFAKATGEKATRRERSVKVYLNPNSGERVETKGGNHKVLKAWKEEFGAETVESWLQAANA